MENRTAILLDENGNEIWRGYPCNMPVRLIEADEDYDVDEEGEFCFSLNIPHLISMFFKMNL